MIKKTINNALIEALTPLKVQHSFAKRGESKLPFVIFNVTDDRGYKFYEDEEVVTKYEIIINIFTKGDYTEIQNEITKSMLKAGFMKDYVGACLYQEDIDVYNQPLYFKYFKE